MIPRFWRLPEKPAFQSTDGLTNRLRIERYDALIRCAQARLEDSAPVAQRRRVLALIARLEARCRREIQRREDATRP